MPYSKSLLFGVVATLVLLWIVGALMLRENQRRSAHLQTNDGGVLPAVIVALSATLSLAALACSLVLLLNVRTGLAVAGEMEFALVFLTISLVCFLLVPLAAYAVGWSAAKVTRLWTLPAIVSAVMALMIPSRSEIARVLGAEQATLAAVAAWFVTICWGALALFFYLQAARSGKQEMSQKLTEEELDVHHIGPIR